MKRAGVSSWANIAVFDWVANPHKLPCPAEASARHQRPPAAGADGAATANAAGTRGSVDVGSSEQESSSRQWHALLCRKGPSVAWCMGTSPEGRYLGACIGTQLHVWDCAPACDYLSAWNGGGGGGGSEVESEVRGGTPLLVAHSRAGAVAAGRAIGLRHAGVRGGVYAGSGRRHREAGAHGDDRQGREGAAGEPGRGAGCVATCRGALHGRREGLGAAAGGGGVGGGPGEAAALCEASWRGARGASRGGVGPFAGAQECRGEAWDDPGACIVRQGSSVPASTNVDSETDAGQGSPAAALHGAGGSSGILASRRVSRRVCGWAGSWRASDAHGDLPRIPGACHPCSTWSQGQTRPRAPSVASSIDSVFAKVDLQDTAEGRRRNSPPCCRTGEGRQRPCRGGHGSPYAGQNLWLLCLLQGIS